MQIGRSTPQSIDATLKERGSRYGKFTDHARITQQLKNAVKEFTVFKGEQGNVSPWDYLEPDQREAIEMIFHKIGRVLSGDPHYADNWHDIVGYAKLVDDRLSKGTTQ